MKLQIRGTIKMYRYYSWILCLFYLMFLNVTWGYPTGKPDLMTQPELRDEQRYPNGTIIGKYSYTDREGNPIHVKYYADEGSYGVELKSIKVFDSSADPMLKTPQPMKLEKIFQTAEPQFKVPAEITKFDYAAISEKYKTNDPLNYLNREISKTKHKTKNSNSDFDVYYQNELNSPKKCSNEKVRVYMDKGKRNIRNSVDNFDAAKFCEQF